MLDYVADTLLADPAMARMLDEPVRHALDSAREMLHSQGDLLRGEKHSAAIVMTSLELESEETFAFMDKAVRLASATLSEDHYWIGESMMYKELKDGFQRELLLLTLLTVLSIFLIVALNFRSVLVPFPLVLCVLTGVYVSVFGSGLGGKELNYVAYLVVQGILMGATIDYAILFTTYFRTSLRATGDKVEALETAYRGASHSILTSGLILSLVPFGMILVLKDPMMEMILRSIGMGAFAVLLLVLFVLPGVLAATFRRKR
jgi:predicted RND superfamily exporter protein